MTMAMAVADDAAFHPAVAVMVAAGRYDPDSTIADKDARPGVAMVVTFMPIGVGAGRANPRSGEKEDSRRCNDKVFHGASPAYKSCSL
jgi:hypothetical protein